LIERASRHDVGKSIDRVGAAWCGGNAAFCLQLMAVNESG